MSTEENKALVRRLVEEVWNQGNLTNFDELYAPDFIFHDPGLPHVRTREEDKQWIAGILKAFPDFHITIEDLIAEGDQVVVRLTGRGTNTGDIQAPAPHPATGKQVTITGNVIARLANGQFVEIWHQVDRLARLVPATRPDPCTRRGQLVPCSAHWKGVSSMSTEENKVIARRFIQVWGQGSLDTLDELAAPNFSVYYPVLNQPIDGPEAFKQLLMGARSAVPDAAIEFLDEIAEGDKVVVRWTVHGTHQGVFLGIPPTGKQVTWSGITIYRIADGKVVEERGEEDALGLMQQLGVIPGPGQPG